MIIEENGSRKFERFSRWNILMYTIVSPKNEFARYTDNYGQGEKLFLTYFKVHPKKYPLKRFKDLDTPIKLKDFSILSKYDEETDLYLEVDEKNEKVRAYKEVTE